VTALGGVRFRYDRNDVAVPAALQEAERTAKEPDMNNVSKAILVAMTLTALAGNAPAADLSPDWMTDEGGVLELKLAHDDKGRPDGAPERKGGVENYDHTEQTEAVH
jgi:hypothetical protein